ncbi:DUF924 family protein [Zooshikella harenae]|uniref:DUF924 domain-containing protein n=1 Tax=Zooshikella harenae TaxID=2827238 RepID=A0ABS5ZD75_9GAMM|nr:DUF924 family protein [Zooshikella harenae]MBU2711935.1 DUF924 domain-containing protein [Zooshikella harenae]
MKEKQPNDVITTWFGELDSEGNTSSEIRNKWFNAAADDDYEFRNKFEPSVFAAADGMLNNWEDSAEGRLALIILLDQIPRNIYRSTSNAFKYDAIALNHAKQAVQSGQDKQLPYLMRVFCYMPYEHSESLADQQQAVKLFKEIADEVEPSSSLYSQMQSFYDYAVQHLEIIEQFGRFPHRNNTLGRASTLDEERYLEEEKTHFGQKS